MDIRELVQQTLDGALYDSGIYSYWNTRVDVNGPNDPDEYIIYSKADDTGEEFANNQMLDRTATIDIIYYASERLYSTSEGRKKIFERINSIIEAMKEAGFRCPFGENDLGDIDEIGYTAILISFEYWRLI